MSRLGKLTNREIVELHHHKVLVLHPWVSEIVLRDGTVLSLRNGEFYAKHKD
jgi:hypothetical protein